MIHVKPDKKLRHIKTLKGILKYLYENDSSNYMIINFKSMKLLIDIYNGKLTENYYAYVDKSDLKYAKLTIEKGNNFNESNKINIALNQRYFIGYNFNGNEFVNAYLRIFDEYTHEYLDYNELERFNSLRKEFQKEEKLSLSLSEESKIIINNKNKSDKSIKKFNL